MMRRPAPVAGKVAAVKPLAAAPPPQTTAASTAKYVAPQRKIPGMSAAAASAPPKAPLATKKPSVQPVAVVTPPAPPRQDAAQEADSAEALEKKARNLTKKLRLIEDLKNEYKSDPSAMSPEQVR